MAVMCRFGWHGWSRWGSVERREFEREAVPGEPAFAEFRKVRYTRWTQDRECHGCGAVQRREFAG